MNTTVNPVETDTRLAELSTQFNVAADAYTAAIDQAHYLNGERPTYRGRTRKVWVTDGPQAVAALRAAVDADTIVFHKRDHAVDTLARIDAAETTMARVRPEIDQLDAVYREHRWSRFITVADGHIHSATVCAGGTIRPTTRIMWNPELSGLDIADAVNQLGPKLCSHCFPSAPVEWTRGEDKPVDPTICTSVDLTPAQREKWNPRRVSSTVTCECGATPSVTRTGKKRKHKRGDLKSAK